MTPEEFEPLAKTLRDAWHRGRPIRLSGFTERHRFAPGFAAFLVLLVCFFLFQVVIAPVAVIGLIAASGEDLVSLLNRVAAEGAGVLSEFTSQLLGANTIGLVFAFGVPALLFAKMSTSQVAGFLRLRRVDWQFVLLSVVGWVVLLPLVQYFGQLNASLPWSADVLRWEEQMLAPIAALLERPDMLVPSLLMIAVAPAICEELLFRGYIQRQIERSAGVDWSLILSGFLFGAYHLQPTKLLPLALLGFYFAYLTWRTGSLIPAMIAHFCQNAFAVIISNVYAVSPDRTVAELDTIVTPWYLALLAAIFFMGVVYLFRKRAVQLLDARAATDDHQTVYEAGA